jgi:sec-independent protein translocase protein TatA
MIGTTELLIIAGVVLVLFGGSAIPKLARSLGRARREFEAGAKEGLREGETRSERSAGPQDDDPDHGGKG